MTSDAHDNADTSRQWMARLAATYTPAEHRAEALTQLDMAGRSEEPYATTMSLAGIAHAILALSAPDGEPS